MAEQPGRSIGAHTNRRKVKRGHRNRRQKDGVQRSKKYESNLNPKRTKKKELKITCC